MNSPRDRLFLLQPGFLDPAHGSAPFICPHSAAVEGLLRYYPFLEEQLEVERVSFPRPREAVVALLGTDHQACPVLVSNAPPEGCEALLQMSAATGRWFAVGFAPIAAYLARAHRVADVHP